MLALVPDAGVVGVGLDVGPEGRYGASGHSVVAAAQPHGEAVVVLVALLDGVGEDELLGAGPAGIGGVPLGFRALALGGVVELEVEDQVF